MFSFDKNWHLKKKRLRSGNIGNTPRLYWLCTALHRTLEVRRLAIVTLAVGWN